MMSSLPNQIRFLVILAIAMFAAAALAQSSDKTQQAITFFNEGQDAHEKGEFETALKSYEKALELLPEFPEAELQRGNALLSLKRPAEAETSYRRALELREEWTLAMASLGSLLVERGKYAEAEPLLKRAIAADDTNQYAIAALADLNLRTKAADAVLHEDLTRLTSLASKVRPTIEVLVAKAAVELRLKETEAARASVLRALEADPKNISANLIAADLALIARDTKMAEAHAKAAESAGAPSDDIKRIRGTALYLQGKKADALATLESIALPDESVKTMIAEIKDGDVADLAGLEAKIQRTPDDANAMSKLCRGFRVSNPAKAIEYCRRASELEPNEIGHAIGFAAALVQAKQYEQAVAILRKLLTIDAENATIRANLATALFQLKRYPEAKAEFRWLTEKQPDSATAFYFLGIVHDQLEEYLDAMANYQQFLRLADAERDKVDIERVNLRMPAVQKLVRDKKGKRSE